MVLTRTSVAVIVAAVILTLSVGPCEPMTTAEQLQLRDEIRSVFFHGYDSYMKHAFPRDELASVSCTGIDTWGAYALTLVDSLDTLVIMGNYSEFRRGVEYASKLDFDRDITVSVFETNIRILGGLLSAHFLAADPELKLVPGYNDELLAKALDIGERLLPAFDTPTGIPYGVVNLKYGVPKGETVVTSTAGGGTFTVEFGVLSRLTRDPRFENAALASVRGLFARRSKLGLVGNHINIDTGEWTHKDAGVGASIDSYYEYFIKAYVLLDDPEYLHMAKVSYDSAQSHLRHDPWYVDVHMEFGGIVWPIFNSLQAFWPGMEVLHGKLDSARRTLQAFFTVWRFLGVTPEGFNLVSSKPQQGQVGYPLRPEMAESAYLLYQATQDPAYLAMGRDMVSSLQSLTRTECGYAAVKDVHGHRLADRMDSYFLAETTKYLYLLFDTNNLVNRESRYVFNTEGHIMDLWQISHIKPHGHSKAHQYSSLEMTCPLPTFSERLTTYGILFPGQEFRQSKPKQGSQSSKYTHRDPLEPGKRASVYTRYDPPTWVTPEPNRVTNGETTSPPAEGNPTSDQHDHDDEHAKPQLSEAARAEYQEQRRRVIQQQQQAHASAKKRATELKEERMRRAEERQAERKQKASREVRQSTVVTDSSSTTTTAAPKTEPVAKQVKKKKGKKEVPSIKDYLERASTKLGGAPDIGATLVQLQKEMMSLQPSEQLKFLEKLATELGLSNAELQSIGRGELTPEILGKIDEASRNFDLAQYVMPEVDPAKREQLMRQAASLSMDDQLDILGTQLGLSPEELAEVQKMFEGGGGEMDPALIEKLQRNAADLYGSAPQSPPQDMQMPKRRKQKKKQARKEDL